MRTNVTFGMYRHDVNYIIQQYKLVQSCMHIRFCCFSMKVQNLINLVSMLSILKLHSQSNVLKLHSQNSVLKLHSQNSVLKLNSQNSVLKSHSQNSAVKLHSQNSVVKLHSEIIHLCCPLLSTPMGEGVDRKWTGVGGEGDNV